MRNYFLLFFFAFFLWAFPSQQVKAQYCQPSYSSGCDFGDGLTFFGLETISQTIGCAVYVNDFTSSSVALTQGFTYTLSLTAGYSSTYFEFWIDLNDNGAWDTGEMMASGNLATSGTTYTYDFTVPVTSTTGSTRMRAYTNYASAPANGPCGSYTYGNSSDFTVIIEPDVVYDCDLAANAWIAPALFSSDLTASEQVTVQVKNVGIVAQSNYSVKYSIDNGANYQTETVTTSLAPGATYNHTFAVNGNFATSGAYDVIFEVVLACDSNLSNNILSTQLINSGSISTFPYFENFDGTATVWLAGGTGSSWQWGVPNASVINSAASPANAWVTNLTGLHNSNEFSWVESPVFNFTGLTAPIVEMKVWYNTELLNDGGALQYSIDGGSTWSHVGAAYGVVASDPNATNWYNGTSIMGLNYMNGWHGNSNGWVNVKYNLYDATGLYTNLAGVSAVMFRVLFGSNAFTNNNGFAFDDFLVYQAPDNDAGITSINSLTAVCEGSVSVVAQIRNFGALNLTSANVGWSVNNVVQTPVTFTGNLAPNTQTDITLGSYTFVSGTVYEVKAWTSLPNNITDQIAFNDTATVSGFMTSLAGLYTVGGTGAHFATVLEAVDALNTYGVCGPTTIEINPGTYTGRIVLTNFTGLSATNHVTFTSSTGNAADVIVNYNATGSADDGVWVFNGANYVTVENISIVSNATSWGRAVIFQGASSYNTVDGCVIQAANITSSLSSGVYSTSTSAESFNTISNNHIKFGYYGVYWYGASSYNESGNKFINNFMEENYYYGIYVYYNNSSEVTHNYVYQSNPLGSTFYYPIMIGYSPSVKVTHNKCVDIAGTTNYGININYCNSPLGDMALVANNMVSISGHTGLCRGLYIYYSNYVKVYNNSVNIAGAGATSYGLYAYAGTTATQAGNYYIVNNSIVNSAGGHAYYWNEAAFLSSTTANNNLYTSGATLATIVASPTLNVTSFATWQTQYGFTDVNVANPYLGIHDLHSNSPILNAGAVPLTEVTDDIDGDPRDAVTPDIGADEFVPLTDDASITAFVGIDAVCPGLSDIEVTVANFGLLELSSVNIYCVINGDTLPPYAYTDTIDVGTSVDVVIGSYTFNQGTVYNLTAWTDSPNGVLDLNTSNDTLTYSGMETAIFGNYTIGLTGDFETITEAVDFMMNNGICGPVVFDIESGIYEEQVSLPAINGSSAVNTITFQSETGNNTDVIITFPTSLFSANWVWRFNGISYCTIQNVTINTTTPNNYGYVVVFEGGSHYNTVHGNKINSIIGTGFSNVPVYSTSNSKDDYNTISNNDLSGGYYGIYWYSSSSPREVGNKFLNNKIVDYYFYGIQVYYNNDVEVHGNTVLQDPNTTASNYPIQVYYCDGPVRVTNNYMFDDNGTFNYGLRVGYCFGTAANRGLIANNMIAVDGVASTNYGLYIYYTQFHDVFHNSVLLNTGTTNYGAYIGGLTSVNVANFKNNSVVVTPANTGSRAMYSVTNFPASLNEFTNNNWYSNGTNLMYWGGTNHASITSWSVFYPGDVISTDGSYYSTDDLHSTSQLLDGGGVPLAAVPFDFDGDPRDAVTPDIGADEFMLYDFDMEVVAVYTLGHLPLGAGDEHVVSAVVRNFGLLTQTNVDVTLSISGDNIFTDTQTIASSAPGQVDTIYFDAFTATTLGWNTVTVSVPTDDNNANNEQEYAQWITDNVMAYADTTGMYGVAGVNDQDGHIFWNKHYMAELALVTNVRAYITGDPNNIGKTVHTAVMNSNNVIVAYSQPLVINNTHQNSWVTFQFADPSILSFSNEEFYIGFVQLATTGAAYSPLGYQMEEPLRSDAYFYSENWNGNNFIPSVNERRYMLAAVLGEPAPLDARLVALINPAGECGMGLEDVVVTVMNNGTVNISGFSVSFQVDANNAITEPVSGLNMAPGDIYTHTFAQPFDFTALVDDTTFNFIGWVTMVGDTVNTNDTIFVLVESMFTPQGPITNTNITAVLGYPYTLTATSPYMIFWYDNPSMSPISSNTSTFTTPALWDSTYTYWVSASTSSIGTFTVHDDLTTYAGTINNPIAQGWTSQTVQYIVRATDLISEGMMMGEINSVAFRVTAPAGAPLQDFTVKMGHTTLNAVTTSSSDWTTNMTEVFNTSVHNSFVGWNEFIFTTPFGWNGIDNLVVQFCFSNGISNWTSNGTVAGETMPYNASIGWYTDGAFDCDLPSFYYNATFMPQFIFNAGVAGCESELVEITINVIKPPYDALLSEMVSPVAGCAVFVENPAFLIVNNGSNPINSFEITYQIDGGTPQTETVSNVSILSDSSYVYTFAQAFDFTGPVAGSLFDIVAWVTLANDTINFNDTISFEFESLFTPDSPTPFNSTTVFGTSTVVSVSTLGNVIWYDDQAGSNMLAMGDTFYTTPVLFDTTSYWAVSTSGVESDITLYGSGASLTAYSSLGNPYGQYYTSVQTQFLIKADDLIAQGVMSGDINSVSLNVSAVAGAPLMNFSISMANSGLTALTGTAASWTNSLQTVYSVPSYTSVVGWNLHEFTTPFYWNGVDNIVIMYCFSNGTSNYTTSATILGQTMTSTAGIGQSTDGVFTCGAAPSFFSTTTFMPQQKFNVTLPGCESEPVEVFAFVTNIPANDAGIASYQAPNTGIELGVEPVIVTIENLGTNDQMGFLISYEIDNGTTVQTESQIVSTNVPAGGSILFEFATLADVSDFGTYTICVYTSLMGDMYSPNDTICWTFENNPLQYCTSNATSPAYEDITEVVFGSFVNSSAPAVGSTYTNFTSLGPIATVYPGMIIPISITSDYPPGYSYPYTCYVKVFIDWNHDGTFDPVNEIAYQSPTTSSSTVTGTVTVPITAVPGTSGMRVVFVETSVASSVQPCGTYTWGETEDYILTVGTPDPWDAALTNVLQPTGTLMENGTSPVEVVVFNSGLNTITEMVISYSIDGGTPVDYTYTGSLLSFQSATVNLGNTTIPGGYFDICAWTTLVNDVNTSNDTTCVSLFALPQFDLAMIGLDSPTDGCDLGFVDVTVVFENLGDTVVDGITLGYIMDNMSMPFTVPYTDTIYPGDVITYTFATPVDLTVSMDTEFQFNAFLAYGPDPVGQNDSLIVPVNSSVSPGSPDVDGVTIWSSEFATLYVNNPDTNLFYSWYSAVDTTLIDQGVTFTTPMLYDTTHYLVSSAAGGGSGSLTTTYVGGNGQSGNMINVTALTGNITIESFDVSFSGTTQIDVFYRAGGFQGFESNLGAWTLLGSVTNLTGGGTGVATPLAIGGLTIPIGQTYGLLITTNNTSIVYTTLTTPPNHTDGNILIDASIGISYPLGSVFSPRDWNGTIYYSSGNGCNSPFTPVAVNVQYADYDCGILDIISPATGAFLGSEPVNVLLYNNGLYPFWNFPISYTVNGGNLVSQLVPDTIQPGDSLYFTFTQPVNLTVFGGYDICVNVDLLNDGNSNNDELCEFVNNMNGNGLSCATSFPYGEVNNPAVVSATTYAYDVEWWSFTATVPYENVSISLCGSSYNTQVSYWLSCSDIIPTASNSNYCGLQSQIDLPGILQPGTYFVRVFGVSTDFGSFTLNITGDVVSKFIVNLTPSNILCNGNATGSVAVSILPGPAGTAASLPISYQWSSGQTSANVSGLSAGTYTVTATDAAGWQEIEQVTITQPTAIAITAVTVDNTAIGGNIGEIDISVSGGTPPYTYLWGNGATTQDLTGLYAGVYSLTVTDGNSCNEVTQVTVHSPSPWTVYPTPISHNIVVPQNAIITLDALSLPAGSFIGVFYDSAGVDVCGGWAYWSQMSTVVTAYGTQAGQDNGFTPGETFKWKVYHAVDHVEYFGTPVYNTTTYPHAGNFVIGGLSGIFEVNAFSIITQTINVPEGWCLWSTYINPTNADIVSVMADIATLYDATSQAVITKNYLGALYWPGFGINTIGSIVIGQGYQTRIQTTIGAGTSFGVTGLKLDAPTTVFPIPVGWSLIAYLKDVVSSAQVQFAAYAQLYDFNSPIEIMKNGAGQLFWPQFGIVSMNMVPGEGYQIKNRSASVINFSYPAANKSDGISLINSTPVHFIGVENTGKNMTLGIPVRAWTVEPMIGDEIGVYDANGKLVGAGVFEGDFTAITVWGKEVMDDSKDKGSNGSIFSIRLYQEATGIESDVIVNAWDQGSEVYSNDAIAVAGKVTISGGIGLSYSLGQNMPNPFKQSTTIPFYVPVDCEVSIVIYNSIGEQVKEVYNNFAPAGNHEVRVETGNLPSGNYFYKFITDGFTDVRSMTINK